MNREKKELLPTLKISVAEDDENGVKFEKDMQIDIEDVRDIETNFGKKTVANVRAGEERYGVFMNQTSINNMIDTFGNDDSNWKGKICNLVKRKDKKFKKEMIVFEPVA